MIRAQLRCRFLAEIDRGYAALREDMMEWQDVESERRVLDGTLMDGLDMDELWTDDGNVVYPNHVRDASDE